MDCITRSARNPHRAYDADGREIPPMTLATMRENGVRSVAADCHELGCRHHGVINVDHLPDDLPVRNVAKMLQLHSLFRSRRPLTKRAAQNCRNEAPLGWAHADRI